MASLIQISLGRFSAPSTYVGRCGVLLYSDMISFSSTSLRHSLCTVKCYAGVNLMELLELHFYSTAFNDTGEEEL